MSDATLVKKRFKQLAPHLNERLRRLWAAAEADAFGFGGAVAVERSTGVSRRAIAVGRQELKAILPPQDVSGSRRIRGPGGGRKRSTAKNPKLLGSLLALVEPGTRGDPEQPLRNSKSRVSRSAINLSPSCSRARATACKPMPKSAKAAPIPTGTRNSSTSTSALAKSNPRASRSSRWIRKRRN
jgi:hypothetical protein